MKKLTTQWGSKHSLIIFGLVVLSSLLLEGLIPNSWGGLKSLCTYIGPGILGLLLACYYIKNEFKSSIRSYFGLHKEHFKKTLILALRFSFFIPVVFFILYFNYKLTYIGFFLLPKSTLFLMLAAAPILEEAFFRGVVDSTFDKYWPIGISLLLSGLFFAMCHVGYWTQPLALLKITCLGVLLSMVHHNYKTILPGMIIHFMNNLIFVITIIM